MLQYFLYIVTFLKNAYGDTQDPLEVKGKDGDR